MDILKNYFQDIFNRSKTGDASEESFYSDLEKLLKNYCQQKEKKKFHITPLPKKTEAGNPDFRVWDGKQKIVGYIEVKAPTIKDLRYIESSEQLKRYRDTFPNLILTNLFEFRLYRNGDLVDQVQIGRPYVLHKLKAVPPAENQDDFFELLSKFFSFSLPKTYTARQLAVELAKRTRFLKEQVIAEELREEAEKGKGLILPFYEAFQKYLIGTLTQEDFADLYSQTITYGLFAARTRAEEGFNRKLAFDNIPHTIGILRDVFKFISLGELPKSMEVIVDDIAEVLAVADVQEILHKFFHEGKGKDPIVHFYETFLAEYDPKEREQRGVYYTPEPVVSYIVRSLNHLLKEQFGKEDGFATSSVTVLDPAAGTLTFLAEAAKLAVEEFTSKYGDAGKKDLIKEHFLKNFYAFELMMAPYAVGHLKMSFLLEEFGYKLQEDERFKLYLTNTLETKELAETELPGMSSLAEESHLAGEVKRDVPVLVILGNPPYSVSSVNKSAFVEGRKIPKKKSKGGKVLKYEYVPGIMDSYKEDVKSERNIQPLSDDYIKFIRFAHWKIKQGGLGMVGMITNNSYLSGLIHRGMRHKLLEDFDEIYILNLHGSSRIGEETPEGSKDENVFDIQQGVAIVLYAKLEEPSDKKRVYYADLWGLRENKHKYLFENDISTVKWQIVKPRSPQYFFVPKQVDERGQYQEFLLLTDIFNEYSTGVATHRDSFITDFESHSLKQRLEIFKSSKLPDDLLARSFGLHDTATFSFKKTRRQFTDEGVDEKLIFDYDYRPFDHRKIYYSKLFIDRPKYKIMQHLMNSNNIALIASRIVKKESYKHIFVTDKVTDKIFLSNITSNNAFVFPVFLHPKSSAGKQQEMFTDLDQEKKPNIKLQLVTLLNQAYSPHPVATPTDMQHAFGVPHEDIFYYIYAVFYSNIYRSKYAEFLKIDFPRVPFTKDYKLFTKLGELGEHLVGLHLMKSKELDKPLAKFQGKGKNKVEKPQYNRKEKRVYINKDQYFEGIDKEVWEYQIGGYQVLNKWLKDRKGRELLLDDIRHYCKVVTAFKKTIEIQKEVDKLYSKLEKNLLTAS